MTTSPALFEPLRIRSRTIRNRIWVSPMCQYSVLDHSGVPTAWHAAHLGSFAIGRAGLILAEASGVVPDGRISDRDTGLWNDVQQEAWAHIVDFLHSQGSLAGIQLAHAGRKASTWPAWGFEDKRGSMPIEDGGWQSVGPSTIAFEGLATPRALETAEIANLVQAFVDAARRAVTAGFDVLEIHAAHGYLVHQFLSPLSNLRTDSYGGSLSNRARFLLEIVRAIRSAVGEEMPIFVRFSASDYAPDGWDVEQTATVAAWARDAGADFFDISSGGNVAGVHIPLGPGYQVHFAEHIRQSAGLDVNAVGLITTPHQAEDVVASGRADAVMLGREMLRDPHFALRAARELGAEIDYFPPQYLRSLPR